MVYKKKYQIISIKLFKLIILFFAFKGIWYSFTEPSFKQLNKIRSYDSLTIINKKLYEEFKKANTQLIAINNNFLFQYYMKNVNLKDTINY